MKENKKHRNRGIAITVSLAALMIALCAVFLNTILAKEAQPAKDGLQSASMATSLGTAEALAAEQENLNIRVYTTGLEPPASGVSAQYAVACMSEISERVLGKPLMGRVFVSLGTVYGGDDLYWSVSGEVDGGTVSCTIDTVSGADSQVYYFAGTSGDWNWFDSWTEEAAEAEQKQADENYAAMVASHPEVLLQPTEEEMEPLWAIKRQAAMDFAATMTDKPHGARAVELVNELGIGDGAKALRGAIVMEGSTGAPEGEMPVMTYEVEVALDNGTYLVLTLEQNTMELLGYNRYDEPYLDYLYG